MADSIWVEKKEDGQIRRTRIGFKNHVPSWKRYGCGHAYMEVTTHCSAQWVSFDAEEVSEGGKSSKRVMLTLNEEAGKALFEQLKEIYGN